MNGISIKDLNDVTWHLKAPQFQPSFCNQDELSLIKERPYRKVFRAGHVFIKAFRLSALEALFARDPAYKEFILSNALSVNKRAPRPLAYGKKGPLRFFIQEAVKGQSLRDFLNQHWHRLPYDEKRAYIKKFSCFLKDLAKVGIIQPDFHLDNVFIDEKKNDFIMIDLHRAWYVKRPLSKVEISEQLRYVIPSFSSYINRRQMLEACSFISKWHSEIRRKGSRFFISSLSYKDVRKNGIKKWKRRIIQGSTNSERAGTRICRLTQVDENIIETFYNFFIKGEQPSTKEFKVGQPFKNSKHTLCLRCTVSDKDFFIKCFRSSGHIKSLSYLFRKARAGHCWQAAWYMNQTGLETILPLFFIQTNNPWREIYGLIGYPWMDDILYSKERVKKILTDKRYSQHFIKRLSFFIWQMHQKGIFHGDCKITNFLVRNHGRDLTIFDLDSARYGLELSDKQRLKDLSVMGRSLEKLELPEHIIDPMEELFNSYAKYHIPWQKKLFCYQNRLFQT